MPALIADAEMVSVLREWLVMAESGELVCVALVGELRNRKSIQEIKTSQNGGDLGLLFYGFRRIEHRIMRLADEVEGR